MFNFFKQQTQNNDADLEQGKDLTEGSTLLQSDKQPQQAGFKCSKGPAFMAFWILLWLGIGAYYTIDNWSIDDNQSFDNSTTPAPGPF